MSKHAPELAAQIPHGRKAITFRNVLIHGYSSIAMLGSGMSPNSTCHRWLLAPAVDELLAKHASGSGFDT